MGTHPIFESDFDCLTENFESMPRISQMFTDEYGNPTSIQMKIAQAWEVEDEQIPGGRRSIPRKMSVEEVAALIDQTMEESITRRNSVLRREQISRERVMDSAKDLCRIINQSVENDELLRDNSFDFNRFANMIELSVSERNILLANDEELEQMGQLTEDDLDIFRGLPSGERASVGNSPAMAQVCKAITELSSTLGDLENTFTRKMEQFLQERPELNNHVTGLKEDIADLIKVLSEKLTGEGDAEAAIDEELANWGNRRFKDEFIKEEQDRVNRIRKQNERKNQRDEMPEAPRESGALPPPGIPTGRKTTDGTPKRPSVRRSRAEEGRSSTTERQGSILRRRKTSTGRRLGSTMKVRMPDDRVADEELTPEAVTMEQFLAGAIENKPKTLQKFLDLGGNVNSIDECKRTALHRACLYGAMDCVQILVRAKAKLNLQDKLGDTALHWACRGGDLQIVKLLVDSGARINAKDKLYSTPMHVAVRVGVQEIVEFLADHGADVNAKDREGDTPMHDAVRLGRYRIVKTLILHGANLRVMNQAKKSPIDMVQLWYKDTKKDTTIEARKKNSVAAKMTDLLNTPAEM